MIRTMFGFRVFDEEFLSFLFDVEADDIGSARRNDLRRSLGDDASSASVISS